PLTRRAFPCAGYFLIWGLTIFLTYPFFLHNPSAKPDPKYDIVRIGPALGEMTIVSRHCRGHVDVEGESCGPCSTLDVEVACVRDWVARESERKHTKEEKEKKTRLGVRIRPSRTSIILKRRQSLHEARDSNTTEARLDILERVIDTLRDNEVPAVHRLLRASQNRKEGPAALLERVRSAAKGTYRPRNFTNTDYDLAAYLYECGGGAALHAASHSYLALPSEKPLRPMRRDFELRISSSGIRVGDHEQNIAMHFRPREESGISASRSPRRRVGVSLAIDETAGQGQPCYLPSTDEIGGPCLEHVIELLQKTGSVTMGDNLPDAMAIAQAIREGKAHIGKEYTCAAISVLSEEGYSAKPIHLSATCKQGGVEHSARLILSCIEAWKRSEWGENHVGPLWAISSDGDATRRAAMYMICMEKELPKSGGLYERLRGCHGLNLFVGDGICTILCSKEGMMANGISVNKQLLATWLPRLTQYDWSDVSIHALLNPKDPQDVPRAVMLLKRVAQLRDLDTTGFSPAERAIHQAFSVIGEALHCLVEPFTNPALSLTTQTTYIIKAAHLFAALYRRHYTSFMSNQLYGDLQCMLKTAIFHVAKTQELDPELKVFLCLLGDNGVETLFGRVRMKGRHNPNMDISDFASRLRSGQNMDDILERHPEWDRPHSRLNLGRSAAYDHIRPRHWCKDIVAKSCNIVECWDRASNDVSTFLARLGLSIDFAALFAQPGFDLMRPRGGAYPGVSKGHDRLVVHDDEPSMDAESSGMVATDELSGECPSVPERPHSRLADLQADVLRNLEATPTVPVRCMWMEIKRGCWQHKKTVLRALFDLSHDLDYRKTHDRLLRLYATLVRVRSDQVALAIAQCSAIRPPDGKQPDIHGVPRAELTDPSSGYSLSGQILSLAAYPSATNELLWYWCSPEFVGFESAKARPSSTSREPTSRNELVFTVPAPLTVLLGEDVAHDVALDNLPQEVSDNIQHDTPSTWIFENSSLSSLRSILWERVNALSGGALALIPTYGNVLNGLFPYEGSSASTGSYEPSGKITHLAALHKAPPPKGEERLACATCKKSLMKKDFQDHTGRHILRSKRGLEASEKVRFIDSAYPCGFCGGPSTPSGQNGACSIELLPGGAKAASTCPKAYSFTISTTSKVYNSKPCTNVPMQCAFCRELHWKYN
ncbi:hypothetical protein EV121DRAFT_190144, partial [Schizophyllum commune]